MRQNDTLISDAPARSRSPQGASVILPRKSSARPPRFVATGTDPVQVFSSTSRILLHPSRSLSKSFDWGCMCVQVPQAPTSTGYRTGTALPITDRVPSLPPRRSITRSPVSSGACVANTPTLRISVTPGRMKISTRLRSGPIIPPPPLGGPLLSHLPSRGERVLLILRKYSDRTSIKPTREIVTIEVTAVHGETSSARRAIILGQLQ